MSACASNFCDLLTQVLKGLVTNWPGACPQTFSGAKNAHVWQNVPSIWWLLLFPFRFELTKASSSQNAKFVLTTEGTQVNTLKKLSNVILTVSQRITLRVTTGCCADTVCVCYNIVIGPGIKQKKPLNFILHSHFYCIIIINHSLFCGLYIVQAHCIQNMLVYFIASCQAI